MDRTGSRPDHSSAFVRVEREVLHRVGALNVDGGGRAAAVDVGQEQVRGAGKFLLAGEAAGAAGGRLRVRVMRRDRAAWTQDDHDSFPCRSEDLMGGCRSGAETWRRCGRTLTEDRRSFEKIAVRGQLEALRGFVPVEVGLDAEERGVVRRGVLHVAALKRRGGGVKAIIGEITG